MLLFVSNVYKIKQKKHTYILMFPFKSLRHMT